MTEKNAPDSRLGWAGVACGAIGLLLALALMSKPRILIGGLDVALPAILGVAAIVLAWRGAKLQKWIGIVTGAVAALMAVFVLGILLFDDPLDDLNLDSDDTSDTSDDEPEPAKEVKPPLALGATAKVGDDYVVSVKEVNLDAGDLLADPDLYNEPAKGQYVLITLKAKYVGNDEGDPGFDLSVKYATSGSHIYDESTCSATVPDDMGSSELPTLTNGGTATWSTCIDVPADEVSGGTVAVEDSASFDETKRVWELR